LVYVSLLNTEAAREYLGGIARPTLYGLIQRKKLRAHLVAGSWKFKVADLEAYLDSVAVGPKST
jgi:excisionase family DNA binding protein